LTTEVRLSIKTLGVFLIKVNVIPFYLWIYTVSV